jgi:hypothetical protein
VPPAACPSLIISVVNLSVDHSQIVQLECLRSGIWGTKSLWARVLTYKVRIRPTIRREKH